MKSPLLLAASAMLAAAAPAPASTRANTATAVFAGGCFWSTETDLDRVPGVLSTTSGYIGGNVANPTYEQVSSRTTGHHEAVKVVYDPKRISYGQLLGRFWRTIDPSDAGGTFCDRGPEYRTAVFVHSEAQRREAARQKAELSASGRFARPIATLILREPTFYPAETYHQDFHHKNPAHYSAYRRGCGRDARLRAIWGESPSDWRS